MTFSNISKFSFYFRANLRPFLESASNLQSFGVNFSLIGAILRILEYILLGVGYTGGDFPKYLILWVTKHYLIDIIPTNSDQKEFLKNNKNSEFSALFYPLIVFFHEKSHFLVKNR